MGNHVNLCVDSLPSIFLYRTCGVYAFNRCGHARRHMCFCDCMCVCVHTHNLALVRARARARVCVLEREKYYTSSYAIHTKLKAEKIKKARNDGTWLTIMIRTPRDWDLAIF